MPDPDLYQGLDEPRVVSGVLLGFDFGTKNIGIAVGQTILKTATPISPIRAKDGIPDWDELNNIIQHWKPVALTVGIPLHMDGETSEMTYRARKFARRLKTKFSLPVFPTDERLSSEAAEQLLLEKGGSKALEKHSVDSLAACLMLERWLITNIR